VGHVFVHLGYDRSTVYDLMLVSLMRVHIQEGPKNWHTVMYALTSSNTD